MIRVLIVGEVKLYRDGLALVLERRPSVVVVGSAPNAADALREAGKLRPDVLLLDMATPGAASSVRMLTHGWPSLRIVGLAVTESEDEIIGCVQAGISGYVPRDGSLDDLVAAIESVAQGEMICPPRITAALARRVTSLATADMGGLAKLTVREKQLADFLDRGLSNKEIAQALHIEVATVKNHIHSILDKLSVRTRGEAAACLRPYTSAQRARTAAPTA